MRDGGGGVGSVSGDSPFGVGWVEGEGSWVEGKGGRGRMKARSREGGARRGRVARAWGVARRRVVQRQW